MLMFYNNNNNNIYFNSYKIVAKKLLMNVSFILVLL
jgi:hypothetical protein